MPSSTGSEPPGASLEQSCGREACNRDVEERYECQMHPKKYQDLHHEAQLLDRQLFQTLQPIVKGSLLSVISQLTGRYACYTFGIIAIWRHHRLSAATRKLSAVKANPDPSPETQKLGNPESRTLG